MAYLKRLVLPAVTLIVAAACGSKQHGFNGNSADGGGGGSSGGLGSDSGPPTLVGDSGIINIGNDGGIMLPSCASASFVAQQAPAAILFVIDASDEMAMNNRWSGAQQAIQQAMDQTAFNSMFLGLLTYPDRTEQVPECALLAELDQTVYCEVSMSPQVPLALAGTSFSSGSSGVRHDILQYTMSNGPMAGGLISNMNPLYDALSSGITALQSITSLPSDGKRMLFVITDGAASCTSQDVNASGGESRQGLQDQAMCYDWEDPNYIITLLKNAHGGMGPNGGTAPAVNTFVVGVNGADTAPAADLSTAPYYVGRAMSAYALAGSPETVPAGCDGAYSTSGANPTTPCDFDLSQTSSFAGALATDIGQIRNTLLGCDFNLPQSNGAPVDMSKVNVTYTTGSAPVNIDKRSSSTDTCTTSPGCWDYTSTGQVELIGAACSAVETSASATVNIVVGCATIIK